MADEYDIFHLQSGNLVWLEVVTGIEQAKRCVKMLRAERPGRYLVFRASYSNRLKKSELAPPHPVSFRTSRAIHSILAETLRITSTTLGTLQIYDPQARILNLTAQVGLDAAFIDHFRVVLGGHAACGAALARRQRVTIQDVATDPIYSSKSRSIMLANYARSVHTVPLINSHKKLIGMVSALYRDPAVPPSRYESLSDDIVTSFADRITAYLAGADGYTCVF
jgi:putative methionine-R-sulfoxide reductase with GAF domain